MVKPGEIESISLKDNEDVELSRSNDKYARSGAEFLYKVSNHHLLLQPFLLQDGKSNTRR